MKLTFNWLKEHIKLNKNPHKIAEDLTSLGLEVEKISSTNSYLKSFYICEVLKVYKHPNADRLKICEISTGEKEYKVVCGANNAVEGLKSIFASNGAFIPGKNFFLKPKSIRGIEGDGMLCSEEELGLPVTQEGIIDLDSDYQLGKNLSDYIEEDFFLQIGLTPNRGDCASVRGLARDLSAKLDVQLKNRDINKLEGKFNSKVEWNISELDNKKDCPLIYGRHFKIENNKESPFWLKQKLISIGMSPISVLVDITNYILYDIGRPLHVFDLEKIKGNLKIIKLIKDEEFIGLDKKTYQLKKGDLVIKDDEKTVSLAGIMGGINSCVDERTKEVYLEVAYFDPKTIAKTGRRTGINSDARYRFERGIDSRGLLEGLEIATKLINNLCGGSFSKYTMSGEQIKSNASIKYDHKFFKQIVGYDIPLEKQKKILNSLSFSVEKKENFLLIEAPSWRHDINSKNDIVEEILRVDGYENIPQNRVINNTDKISIFSDKKNLEFKIRESFAKFGLYEAITFTFISEKKNLFNNAENKNLENLKLENPISSEMNLMRNSLLPNLLDISARNFAKGIDTTEIFEIGYIFDGIKEAEQKSKSAILISGYENKKTWHHRRRNFDFFDIKSKISNLFIDLEISEHVISRSKSEWLHPGVSADLIINDCIIASFGELHPSLKGIFNIKQPTFIAEINNDVMFDNINFNKENQPLIISPFLPLKKDFAFLLPPEKSVQSLLNVIKNSDEHIGQVNVFDLYSEDKSKLDISVGVEVELIQKNKVFNSEEISYLMDKIIKNVQKELNARLRDS